MKSYQKLWNRLRDEYGVGKQQIFLIQGHYPVAYEGGYDWIVGYRSQKHHAELKLKDLRGALSVARKDLSGLWVASKRAWAYLQACEEAFSIRCPSPSHIPYDDDEPYEERDKRWSEWSKAKKQDATVQDARQAWLAADDNYRKAVDNYPFLDSGIPYPASHLFQREGGMDGPISYSITAVDAL